MKTHSDARAALYGPVQCKNFPSALAAFLVSECPMLGGERVRRVLVENITALVERFYPVTTHLRPGQLPWVTVSRDQTASHGKPIDQTPLTTVTLDLVRPQDAAQLATGKTVRQLRKDTAARLLIEADAQGGCLTHTELALLLKVHPNTASRYTREWEAEHGRVLPRRGTLHDFGPTMSHKAQIVRKIFLEGKAVEQVQRETGHSPQSIHRYITAFKQVLLCRRRRLSDDEVAYATHISPSVVREYLALIEEMARENIALDRLLKAHEEIVQ